MNTICETIRDFFHHFRENTKTKIFAATLLLFLSICQFISNYFPTIVLLFLLFCSFKSVVFKLGVLCYKVLSLIENIDTIFRPRTILTSLQSLFDSLFLTIVREDFFL